VRRRAAPEAAFELALYESLLGLWPALAPGVVPPARQLAELRERLLAFARKAAREARLHTGWIDPDASYEAAIARFVTHLLRDRGGVLSDFSRASAPLIVQAGALALARRVVQLASPGVPDIYQGDELGLRALVDPDNRRPVDFARARRRLAELERLLRGSSSHRAARLAELADGAPDERLTLWVTQAALAARRRMPALFARGDYVPLQLSGAGGATWLAFARRRGPAVALVAARIRVVPDGLRPRALLRLPAWLARASLRCALTGRRLQLASRELAVERVASGPIGLWLGRVGGPEK
jgi:(1->4)-alpha-D-glucan 1-alpha-D-glucosylmutase